MRSHHCGRSGHWLDVTGIGLRIRGQQLGQALGVAFDDLALPRHQGRAGGHRLARFGDGGNPLLAAQGVRAFQQPAAEGLDRGLATRTGAHRLEEVLLEELHPSVEQVFFGREVVEHRDLGDVGGAGNLRHGHVLETPPGEQSSGAVEDGLPGLLFLARPEPDLCEHSSSLVE